MVGLTRSIQRISLSDDTEHTLTPRIKLFSYSSGLVNSWKENALKLSCTCLFLVGAYVCCCLLLAHIKGQITRSLMYANYLALVHFHTRADKHLTSFLWTRKCIRSSSSILKSDLQISFLHFKNKFQTKNIFFLVFFFSLLLCKSVIQMSREMWKAIWEIKEITKEPWSRVLISPAHRS